MFDLSLVFISVFPYSNLNLLCPLSFFFLTRSLSGGGACWTLKSNMHINWSINMKTCNRILCRTIEFQLYFVNWIMERKFSHYKLQIFLLLKEGVKKLTKKNINKIWIINTLGLNKVIWRISVWIRQNFSHIKSSVQLYYTSLAIALIINAFKNCKGWFLAVIFMTTQVIYKTDLGCISKTHFVALILLATLV